MLTLAGPIAGLGLSVGSYYLHRAIGVGVSAPADYVLQLGFGANLVWAVYNLLPVQPLDGGRVAMAVLMRLFGRTGFLLAHLLALALAMAIVAYFLIGSTSNQLLVVLFMASYAVRSVGAIAAYLRGELPVGGPLSMLAQQQARAWELFRAGNLEEAEAQVNTTLEGEPRPAIKAGAHHLLGWICLKRGKGREALDHFSQVQKMKVEKVALAAAYSLIGDEARALPLWEQAFVETRDQTVLHEWAGALLRADRESEVRRLPGGVDLATAWACARSVLVLRGDHAAAALAGEEELRLRPTPSLAYDTACAFARSGTKDAAMRLLDRAAQLGFDEPEHARNDPDLTSLLAEPRFDAWLQRLNKSAAG